MEKQEAHRRFEELTGVDIEKSIGKIPKYSYFMRNAYLYWNYYNLIKYLVLNYNQLCVVRDIFVTLFTTSL